MYQFFKIKYYNIIFNFLISYIWIWSFFIGLFVYLFPDLLINLSFLKIAITWIVIFLMPGILFYNILFGENNLDLIEKILTGFAISIILLAGLALITFWIKVNIVISIYIFFIINFILLSIHVIMGLKRNSLIKRYNKNNISNIDFDIFDLFLILAIILSAIILYRIGAYFFGDPEAHLSIIRKIADLKEISVTSVVYYKGLPDVPKAIHPAYRLPIWHFMLALLSKISGTDSIIVWNRVVIYLTAISIITYFKLINILFKNKAFALIAALFFALYIFVLINDKNIDPGHHFKCIAVPDSLCTLVLIPLTLLFSFKYIVKENNKVSLFISVLLIPCMMFIHISHMSFFYAFIGAYAVINFLINFNEKEKSLRAIHVIFLSFIIMLPYLIFIYRYFFR